MYLNPVSALDDVLLNEIRKYGNQINFLKIIF